MLERLNRIPEMTDEELETLKVDLKDCENLDELNMYIIDEVYDYEDVPEKDKITNKNVLSITRHIVKLIQSSVCEKRGDEKFTDLTPECKIKVIEKLIPDVVDDADARCEQSLKERMKVIVKTDKLNFPEPKKLTKKLK